MFPEVNCDQMIGAYKGNNDMLNNYAKVEWYYLKKSGMSVDALLKLSTENLQCFCDTLVTEKGIDDAILLEETVTIKGDTKKGHICAEYLASKGFNSIIDASVPLVVIVCNLALKFTAIIMIQFVKFERRTIEVSKIQSTCFMLIFFNSAFAILLINANVKDLDIPIPLIFLDGRYADFSENWYRHVSGFIISPMYIQIIMPVIYMLVEFALQGGLAILDRRCTKKSRNMTTCHTAYEYAELNSGTEHLLFEKYPRLMNMVCLAIMYGMSLPILFPIVFVALIISYIVDKLAVVYYHRKPPLYDDALNRDSVSFMKWSALLYAGLAFW